MEFDWWSTVQPHEKLPYVHVVHWFGVFSLDFGHYFYCMWWNGSCLACEWRQSDWCKIHTQMRQADWCKQYTTLHANIVDFVFYKKKTKKCSNLPNW